jgi:hypothetical protein
MLGASHGRIAVVVAEIPVLVGADLPIAPWADDELATIQATGKVTTTTAMLGAVELAVPAVA